MWLILLSVLGFTALLTADDLLCHLPSLKLLQNASLLGSSPAVLVMVGLLGLLSTLT